MKISSFIISSLMLLTSFVYAANLAPYLQVKKNSTKNTGITYTAVLPGEYEGDAPREFIISERGDNKLLESKEYTRIHPYQLHGCDTRTGTIRIPRHVATGVVVLLDILRNDVYRRQTSGKEKPKANS